MAGIVMPANSEPLAVHQGRGSVDMDGVKVPISETPLPILYFDTAPTLSYMNGIVGVTLMVGGNVPTIENQLVSCASVVAVLKCSVAAAVQLRGCLDAAILLAQAIEEPEEVK
jgi:hypothetical protein